MPKSERKSDAWAERIRADLPSPSESAAAIEAAVGPAAQLEMAQAAEDALRFEVGIAARVALARRKRA